MSAPGFEVPPIRPGIPLVQRVGRTPRAGDERSRRRDDEQSPDDAPGDDRPRAPGDENTGRSLDVEA